MATIPLSDLEEGSSAIVVELCAGWQCRKRMAELGFAKGTTVRVIRAGPSGPLIVELKGSGRMALGRGEAAKIMVETE
ncbi:ferrous iron transport protein A [Candidatus Micrarchaeota archaeon]|nr:ferrous iron transport protein A [Candidatus Micrarchaeota archaeon]